MVAPRARDKALRLLALAPTPTFALLAVLAAGQESSVQSLICSGAHSSLMTGMVPMYGLMSLFHMTPWIRMVALHRDVPDGG